MTIANFFDRATAAAAHILHGFDPAAFGSLLESHSVGLAFDRSVTESDEAAVTLELTTNLLARLYPRLAILPLDRLSRSRAESIAELARAINPDIAISSRAAAVDHCLVVGRSKAPAVSGPIYVGSDRWLARLNLRTPIGSSSSGNPIGAAAAACFGTANLFRAIFYTQLPAGDLDVEINLSMLDYQDDGQNPDLNPIEFKDDHLVGIGAVGNALVWTLSRLSVITGTVHLVDHEAIELSNLQRYVLATQNDVYVPKVTVASKWLSRPGVEVILHEKKWAEYLAERGNCQVERVAVSVDSAEDRIAIQGALPRVVLNAWTQPQDLGVSRHHFDSTNACLACLYWPDSPSLSEDEIIARAIGMPESLREVRQLLYQGAPVTREFLSRVAQALALPLDPLLAFENQSLRAFYQRAFCGGIIFKLSKGQRPVQALVPMAFQSALAGVMLASDLIADAGALRRVALPAKTTINLLRPLAIYRSFPAKKHPSGRCICQDQDYGDVFSRKWGGRGARKTHQGA